MDKVTDISEILQPYIYFYDDTTSMQESIDKPLSSSEATKRSQIKFMTHIRDNCSFDSRALKIEKMANTLIEMCSENRRQING